MSKGWEEERTIGGVTLRLWDEVGAVPKEVDLDGMFDDCITHATMMIREGYIEGELNSAYCNETEETVEVQGWWSNRKET